jgi:hypothetical protein
MKNNKAGFIGVILVLVAAAVIAALGLLVYTQNKEAKSEATTTVAATTTPVEVKQDNPAEFVKDFYIKYLDRQNMDFATGAERMAYYNNSPEKYSEVTLVEVNYDGREIGDKTKILDTDIIFDNYLVTKRFVDSLKDFYSKDPSSDPIVCGQDSPDDTKELSVETVSNDGVKAKVNVKLLNQWEPIPLYMVNDNGWKIDKIACDEK